MCEKGKAEYMGEGRDRIIKKKRMTKRGEEGELPRVGRNG